MRKSRGEYEDEFTKAIIRFEKEYLGRGPLEAQTYFVSDMVMVRLRGILTPAEARLAETREGQTLVKETRRQLIETSRGQIEEIVRELQPTGDSLSADVGRFIFRRYGIMIPPDAWRAEAVPAHLRPRVEVVDGDPSAARRLDRRHAADVVEVAVRDDDGPDVAGLPAQRPDEREDSLGASAHARVHEREAVLAHRHVGVGRHAVDLVDVLGQLHRCSC